MRRALRLEYLTVGWNIVEGIVAVTAAVLAGSVALLGFGIDSFVECASAPTGLFRRSTHMKAKLISRTGATSSAFFGGEVPPGNVRAGSPAVQRQFGVSTLPDTCLVKAGGTMALRFTGARDRRAPEAKALLTGQERPEP